MLMAFALCGLHRACSTITSIMPQDTSANQNKPRYSSTYYVVTSHWECFNDFLAFIIKNAFWANVFLGGCSTTGGHWERIVTPSTILFLWYFLGSDTGFGVQHFNFLSFPSAMPPPSFPFLPPHRRLFTCTRDVPTTLIPAAQNKRRTLQRRRDLKRSTYGGNHSSRRNWIHLWGISQNKPPLFSYIRPCINKIALQAHCTMGISQSSPVNISQ